MKTEKLHISFDDFFDFRLIGISCQEKDYRLCWGINQALQIDLSRVKDEDLLSREHIKGFPFYEFFDEEKGYTYRLIANRFEQKILLKELKTIDYLFLVQAEEADIHGLIEKIAGIGFVFLASEIEVGPLKEKDLLYLDE